ncbi:MAG: hypothetical protein RR301_12460, partial [Clostridia bacterium]
YYIYTHFYFLLAYSAYPSTSMEYCQASLTLMLLLTTLLVLYGSFFAKATFNISISPYKRQEIDRKLQKRCFSQKTFLQFVLDNDPIYAILFSKVKDGQ